MSKLQELLDLVEEIGGDVEGARKAVLDCAAALSMSTERAASYILMCMRSEKGGKYE